ncbi:glycine zipper domain-containing protein [Neobacillus kokaensis]|uniref:Glycine zipper domain-containing protein n=1 Tax=Neobacillus kokaensis TaxID=2759023 RepID=A0ABQ3N8H3_9BACI|nr:glycine zipper domain-containing protein [Neobacillus kokaensis]GHH99837.1 hypothetical protein AM1BK_33800 [Neobacillus kokaensis]
MASKIIIHPDTVKSSIAGLDQNIARLLSVQNNAVGLRYSVDPKILNRKNLGYRLAKACAELDDTAAQMKRLKSFATASAEQYQAAEKSLDKKFDTLTDKLNPVYEALNNRLASDTYELYNDTVGRLGDVLHGLQYMGGAGIMHLLGFKFNDIDGVLRKFEVAEEVLYKNRKIPVGKLIQKVEGSRFNFLARLMVNYKTLFKFKDKSLAELIYKRFSGLFPKDIVNLSNSVSKLKHDWLDAASLKDGLNAVKNQSGQVLKSALKVGKANMLTAALITAGVETVGAGIKITENYSIYGGNIEKLKEENAKVVGSAVYKTGVVTATSVGGAVIGGAIGSLAGPVGTVIGASAGGFVGSLVGDWVTEKTPEFVNKTALHFKDSIYNVTEGIASGVNKVKDGFESVKSHASNLLNGSKKFFGFGH